MECPLTMGFQYEPLFKVMIAYLSAKDFSKVITGLFKDGTPNYIHLAAYIKSVEGVNTVIAIIDNDKSLLT